MTASAMLASLGLFTFVGALLAYAPFNLKMDRQTSGFPAWRGPLQPLIPANPFRHPCVGDKSL